MRRAPQEKAGRLRECIEIMRKLWSEKIIDYDGRYYKLHDVGILPHPVQKAGIPIWIVADRSENGFKRVGRLGDGWVTLAPNLERFSEARRKIDQYAAEHGRADRCRTSALYVAFNLHSDGECARSEGWRWMEHCFAQPKERLAHFFTLFGTPAECVQVLKDYAAARLTMIIARIASDDPREQARILLNEVKPQLSKRENPTGTQK